MPDDRIEVALLRSEWADPDVPLPAYASAGAAGADLRANLPEAVRQAGLNLAPMERAVVPTGLLVALPYGVEMQIRPRSGLAVNLGITVINAPGTIDWDYRGELRVALVNLGDSPVIIEHGMRIAQLVVARVARVRFALADTLDETDRGGGGFGSTGTD